MKINFLHGLFAGLARIRARAGELTRKKGHKSLFHYITIKN
jgi:hypothetical protein